MQIKPDHIDLTCPEIEIFESILSLDNQHILELGCGDASLTRLIANGGAHRSIIASEVDSIQHKKNLLIPDLPNVQFIEAGSENIPCEDNTFDTVLMFKSLHHVPTQLLDTALLEIHRVLKPGGKAYISEPIFKGEFNDVLRIFHDEEFVRDAAFNAIKKSVDSKLFDLEQEVFFYTEYVFENFPSFEDRVIGATHSEHQLSDDILHKVRWKFDRFLAQNQGIFKIPNRVDLLYKPES